MKDQNPASTVQEKEIIFAEIHLSNLSLSHQPVSESRSTVKLGGFLNKIHSRARMLLGLY
jgi:hypothetical protein